MNRSESKYFNTARLMDEALISLLETKDFEYITVKEICKAAGVNRSTFYLHYDTIGDLLNETMENVNRRFLAAFDLDAVHFASGIAARERKELLLVNSAFLHPYLNFIRENQKVFRASYKNPKATQAELQYRELKERVLEPILSKFDIPEENRHYLIGYYIHGIMAVIQEWILGGCQDSVEKIGRIIEECVLPSEEIYREISGERNRCG